MMFDSYTHDDLYSALLARDPSFEGRKFVGVKTTGIFCRLTCSARKPKQENCDFFDTVGACMEAGYRPCKRCKPLAANAALAEPAVADLVGRLEANPSRRWRESDVSALGYDPSTVRRQFRRAFGITFLEMSRQLRLRLGFETLKGGERVIDAQIDAGFLSPSGFRDAFAALLGVVPASLTGGSPARASWIDTPLGSMIAVTDQTHVHLLEFVGRKALATELRKLNDKVPGGISIGETTTLDQLRAELAEYFDGKRSRFDVRMKLWGSDFTKGVWQALTEIPAGETRSYADIARAVGNPNAVRAVARANGANQLAILVPCHRVIGSDGSLTGYAGGLWRKEKLIKLEQAYQQQVSP